MTKLNLIQESSCWYKDGLRFECTGCGQCCTGSPGYVWVDDKEIQEIADFLKCSLKDFAARFLRKVNGRFSLLELPKTFDCIFLKDKKCQIYSVRPTQCRTFPWWPQLLKSREEWLAAATFCEGIRQQANLVPLETIEEQLKIQIEYNENAE